MMVSSPPLEQNVSYQSPNLVNHQQKYVSKNRFFLFSNQIEESVNFDNNSNKMELEPEQRAPTPTIVIPSPFQFSFVQ
jgi:hypothetical protein